MIPYLLFCKIVQLFAVMAAGFTVSKLGVVKKGDSLVLSKLALFLLMPAALIKAFSIEMTPEIKSGRIIAVSVSIFLHFVLLAIDWLYAKITHASAAERASVIYSNAANLIIPIVSFVLGEEWVIYSCAFMSVQIVFLWTHCISLFNKESKFNIKKILLNPNIIAVIIGTIIMVSGLKLPSIVYSFVSDLGGMVGTFGMLIAGMLMADMELKKVFSNLCAFRAVVARMIVCPAIVLLILRGIRIFDLGGNSDQVLLIVFLACMTPTAATVTQMSQLNHNNEEIAISVNVVSTLLSVVTMPLFVALY